MITIYYVLPTLFVFADLEPYEMQDLMAISQRWMQK